MTAMNANPEGKTTYISLIRNFASSPEKVFDAWLDPASAKHWLFTTAGGEVLQAEIDPTEGGAFVFTERRNGEEVEHRGNYLIIDRPRRLVFIFSVPKYSVLETPVTVTFTASGNKGCQLALLHEYVPEQQADATKAGWNKILLGLAATLGENAVSF